MPSTDLFACSNYSTDSDTEVMVIDTLLYRLSLSVCIHIETRTAPDKQQQHQQRYLYSKLKKLKEIKRTKIKIK